MNIRLLGAVLIVGGCGSIGWLVAAAYLREEKYLHRLRTVLEYMICELQYKLTPLPQLCRLAAQEQAGALSDVFQDLAAELEAQISPDAESCMQTVLVKYKNLPNHTRSALQQLGMSLGKFDLQGQIKGIEGVIAECKRRLDSLTHNKDTRLRSCRTLGFCAGAAIVILLF